MKNISLNFPKDRFTLDTYNYQGKEIVYRMYRDIPYCTKPVDIKYQTLNVKEPVSIDGVPVDASNAPIFFGIGCAGLLSTTANSGGTFGPPPGADGPMGPGGPGGPGRPPMPPKDATQITSSEEWEAMAGGEGHAGSGIMGIATLGSFQRQMPAGPGPGDDGEPMAPDGSRWGKLALGYVIVEVGCRGRENQWPDGTYYGKAPAAIVDLKAAVRYIRHNKDVFPGDCEKIITTGGSGGGWQSTLVAASGNCAWFEPYLEAIGAAKERDDVFASYSTSPIIDQENADGAIEFQGGGLITDPEEKKRSDHMTALFGEYLKAAGFQGRNGYGTLTLENLGEYIAKEYLIPDATRYLKKLDDTEQKAYLSTRPWIKYDGEQAALTFEDFGLYATRDARVPAFDDLGMSQPSPILFGNETTNARHFTDYSEQLATGDASAKLDPALVDLIHSQNPTWHILQKHSDVAPHWWIRHGACDPSLAVPPAVLLATALENAGKDVNCRLVWDGGHCEDDDQEVFLSWVAEITGHTL